MYKHILLPTDGSAQSESAIRSAVTFAAQAGAQITGMHVIARQHEDLLEAWLHHDADYAERQHALFKKLAAQYLASITDQARAAGVPCRCKVVSAATPHQAIVDTAQKEHCDLIFMAAHGRPEEAAQLPGSVTLKVLLGSAVPVLVHKSAARGR